MPPKAKADAKVKKAEVPAVTIPTVPDPEPPVVISPPVPVAAVQEEKKVITIETLIEEMSNIKTLHAQLGKCIQSANLMAKKLSKTMQPKKKRTRKPQAQPSGFARPGPITHELSSFLEYPKGEPVARTTVTKQMSAYIKDKGLQNPERKREIVLDDKLAKLFVMDVGDTIEYFEIQKLLKNHYIKAAA